MLSAQEFINAGAWGSFSRTVQCMNTKFAQLCHWELALSQWFWQDGPKELLEASTRTVYILSPWMWPQLATSGMFCLSCKEEVGSILGHEILRSSFRDWQQKTSLPLVQNRETDGKLITWGGDVIWRLLLRNIWADQSTTQRRLKILLNFAKPHFPGRGLGIYTAIMIQ